MQKSLSGLKINSVWLGGNFIIPDLKFQFSSFNKKGMIFSQALSFAVFYKITSLIFLGAMAKKLFKNRQVLENILIEEKKCYRNNFRFSVRIFSSLYNIICESENRWKNKMKWKSNSCCSICHLSLSISSLSNIYRPGVVCTRFL